MRVSIICVADRPDRLPCLYWSLVAQTHKDWEFLVLDQTDVYDDSVTLNINTCCMNDPRMPPSVKVHRYGDWGQTVKERVVTDFATGDVLIFPADDAYYVPTALEWLVRLIEVDGNDVALCGWLYDKLGYAAVPPSLAKGFVDVGGFMVRREAFLRVGWRDKGQTGDHTLLMDLANSGAKFGVDLRYLYVKN